jgi:hypothetical protein
MYVNSIEEARVGIARVGCCREIKTQIKNPHQGMAAHHEHGGAVT